MIPAAIQLICKDSDRSLLLLLLLLLLIITFVAEARGVATSQSQIGGLKDTNTHKTANVLHGHCQKHHHNFHCHPTQCFSIRSRSLSSIGVNIHLLHKLCNTVLLQSTHTELSHFSS